MLYERGAAFSRRGLPWQVPAQARAQDVEGDGEGLRVRVGDDPKRHEERQGRAERDNNGLELGGFVQPKLDKKSI